MAKRFNQPKFKWVASDLHFRHLNIIKFDNGRPFQTIEEHDETLIANWNALVQPEDNCLLLGDIAFNTGLEHIPKLNGRKTLIMGNHEHKNISTYLPYFNDIKSCFEDKSSRIIFTHIPIHVEQLHRWKANVHGHTHHYCLDDPRYINVCMEQTEYKPIHWDELMERISK